MASARDQKRFLVLRVYRLFKVLLTAINKRVFCSFQFKKMTLNDKSLAFLAQADPRAMSSN